MNSEKGQLLWAIITGILYSILIVIAIIYQFKDVFTEGESLIADLIIIGVCWISTRLSIIEGIIDRIDNKSNFFKATRMGVRDESNRRY